MRKSPVRLQPQSEIDLSAGQADRRGDARCSSMGLLLAIGLAGSLLCVFVLLGIAVLTGGMALNRDAGTVPNASAAQSYAAATAAAATLVPTRSPAPSATALTLGRSVPAGLTATITVTVQPVAPAAVSTTTVVTSTARQLRVFHRLWDIVNENYIYRDFNGVDWPAARTTMEQAIRAGIPDERFYDEVRNLIASLKDDHSSFLSPTEALQEQDDYSGIGNYVGVGIISDINVAKKYAFVLQVLPGSPAQAAGIHPHDHILNINGEPSVDAENGTNTKLLRGIAGSTVTITVQSPGGAPRRLVMTRANLPTAASIESRLLPGRKQIGYLLVPTFFEEDLQDRVRRALQGLMAGGNLDGLIVDMRINGGGAYPVLLGNLALFTHGAVGSLVDSKGTVTPMTVLADPVGSSQTVTMAVLIGPATQSYAEVFSGVLQAERHAMLLGQRSAGNIETLRGHQFEDGSMAWIAEEAFHLPNGVNWEGKGLTPDVVIDNAWDEYTTETDPILAAALKALSTGSR